MFKIYFLAIALLFSIHLLINQNSVEAATKCVDMLEYFKPNIDHGIRDSGGRKYIVEDGTTLGGMPTFFWAKTEDGTVYEEFAYDDEYIYHGRDTSWATGPGQDVTCLDGRAAGFTMVDGAVSGCEEVDLKDYRPAKWVQRYMCEEEEMNSNHTVVAFAKDGGDEITGCGCCNANYTGTTSFAMRFNKHYDVFNTPEYGDVEDVVEIEIRAGNGFEPSLNEGEKFYYSKKLGWIGFKRPGKESNLIDELIIPKPTAPIDYCPLVNAEEDTLSCEEPLDLNADTSCATCSVTGEVENASSVWGQLAAFVSGLFTSTIERDVALMDYKGVIPPIKGEESRQIGSKNESPLAYITGPLDENFNYPVNEPVKNGNVPPKIANIDKFAPPGKSTQDLQREYQTAYNAPSKVLVKIDGSGDIPHADMRVKLSQQVGCTVTNSFWATPENQICWTPPVGYTLEEAFGAEKTKGYTEYLAQARTNYLAKNYSNEQLDQLAFNSIKQRQISNNVKYNPNYSTTNENTGKIQTAANQSLSVPACLFPVKTHVKTACSELLGKNKVTVRREVGKAKCTNNGDGTGGCDSNTATIDIGVVVGGYGGSDITAGVSAPGSEATCDAECALKQNTREYQIANLGGIDLVANRGGYSGGYNNPGYTALASTLYMAFSPPEKAKDALTEMSEEIPINVSATGSKGFGNLTSNSFQENSVAGFAKNCSLRLLTALSLIPGSQEAQSMEKILAGCEGAPQVATQSYCGTITDSITNNSLNYKIYKQGYSDPESGQAGSDGEVTRLDTKWNFIDSNSDLKLTVANRHIDGATLILNHEVVSMNPGQTSAARCGVPEGGGGNSANFKIRYFPLDYPLGIDLSNESHWENYASQLEYTANTSGYANVLASLNVKEGHYKIKVQGHACIHPPKYVGWTQGYITLKNSNLEDKKHYCAKITLNSTMPGGGSIHPITKEPYNNKQTEILGCTLSSKDGYNVLANNQCGGLGGGDGDFWKKVANINSSNVSGFIEQDGYTYEKSWLLQGKELYKQYFYNDFNGQANSCGEIFPSVVKGYNGGECNTLDNRDISQSNPNQQLDPNITVTELDPSYEALSPLPITGKAMYYGQGLMQQVINRRIGWGHISPDHQAKIASNYYVGYVALLRSGDIDREVWITNPLTGKVEGPFLVTDVAARHDIPSLLNRGWVVDVDYETGKRWQMTGWGPRPVTVYGSKP